MLILRSEFLGVNVGVLFEDINLNNMSHLTQVLYYLPEDMDDTKQLNCFIIHKEARNITLKDVRANFPLPGDYHFRFQYLY